MTEYTRDTNIKLEEGMEVFVNEWTGDYYETHKGMISDCYRRGMTKHEIKCATDLESDSLDCGYLYMTTYSE